MDEAQNGSVLQRNNIIIILKAVLMHEEDYDILSAMSLVSFFVLICMFYVNQVTKIWKASQW